MELEAEAKKYSTASTSPLETELISQPWAIFLKWSWLVRLIKSLKTFYSVNLTITTFPCPFLAKPHLYLFYFSMSYLMSKIGHK